MPCEHPESDFVLKPEHVGKTIYIGEGDIRTSELFYCEVCHPRCGAKCEKHSCELEFGHVGPHEKHYLEWWGDGPLVYQYGDKRTSERIKEHANAVAK